MSQYILFGLKAKKIKNKKGLSLIVADISLWTHFCHIALRGKPDFWRFFFLLIVSCQENKIGKKK